jgi:hypothetical protein
MNDSLKAFETLTAADLPEPAARAIVQAIDLATEGDAAKLEADMHEMETSLKQDFAGLRHDFAGLNQQFASLGQDFASLGRDFASLRQDFAELKASLAAQSSATKADIIQWMFAFWAAQFFGSVALVLTVVKLLK